MAWADGKAALVTKLAAVAITSPVAITTSVVHTTPPATLQDDYSWVLFPPRIRPERHPGGWRTNNYRYRARLFVRDQDHKVAAQIVENIVEATIAAFDTQAALRTGGVMNINGPDVDEPGIIQLPPNSGQVWHIADCLFDIELGEAKTFS